MDCMDGHRVFSAQGFNAGGEGNTTIPFNYYPGHAAAAPVFNMCGQPQNSNFWQPQIWSSACCYQGSPFITAAAAEQMQCRNQMQLNQNANQNRWSKSRVGFPSCLLLKLFKCIYIELPLLPFIFCRQRKCVGFTIAMFLVASIFTSYFMLLPIEIRVKHT